MEKKATETELIVAMVKAIRKRQRKVGAVKLYKMLKNQFREAGIKIGRDSFCRLIREQRLLVPKSKRYHVTTNSKHHFYKSPNLVEHWYPCASERVYKSDITYLRIAGFHGYLALVTDYYSKRIMGFMLDDNMRVDLVIEALEMALRERIFDTWGVIHHSDRGIQYCCPAFAAFAEKHGVILSTTERYDPYQNAVAERINGILKQEFGLGEELPSLEVARKMVAQAIAIYNNERLHYSLGLITPNEAHRLQKHVYRSYAKKRTMENSCKEH